jgi:hypothetical protein
LVTYWWLCLEPLRFFFSVSRFSSSLMFHLNSFGSYRAVLSPF